MLMMPSEPKPDEALVLLWHWTQTSSPDVPSWALAHPAWPERRRDEQGQAKCGHLRRAALPLIREIEATLSTRPLQITNGDEVAE